MNARPTTMATAYPTNLDNVQVQIKMMKTECSGQDDSMDTDGDFTPTADMLVHEYDDEATMDDEEETEPLDSQLLELKDLRRESDMPLDELLSLYGYNFDECAPEVLADNESTDSLDQQENASCEEKNCSDTGDSSDHSSKTPSKLRYIRGIHNNFDSNSDIDEDDDYLLNFEEEEKSVRIGIEYQAVVPEGLCRYDDALPYENEDKLLWDPKKLSESEIEKYLNKIRELKCLNSKNDCKRSGDAKNLSTVFRVRKRSRPNDLVTTKDDEQALYLLLQCGFNIEEALRRQRLNVMPPTNMSLWSEDECMHFENGLCSFGKDFHQIQLHMVRTRSVEELVQFYYSWKKSERHDLFVGNFRMEKKKYDMHPEITDFMEKCNDEPGIEEQPELSGESGDSSSTCNNGEYVFNSGPEVSRTLRHLIDDDSSSDSNVTLLLEHVHGPANRSCVLRQ